MSTELYLGLVTLQSGVLAVFSAAFFVLIQSATDVFGAFTPQFLIKRTSAISAVVLSMVLVLFGLAASVRSAFPSADLLPGDWRSDVILEEIWPAIAFVMLMSLSFGVWLLALWRLLADLTGPALVAALGRRAVNASIVDWLDFVEPPRIEEPGSLLDLILKTAVAPNQPLVDDQSSEVKTPLHSPNETSSQASEREARNKNLQNRIELLRVRHEAGKLADPLSDLFEVAARSVEGKRYILVDRALAGIEAALDDWLDKELTARSDARRLKPVIKGHFADLEEVAKASHSVNQLATIVRSQERLAISDLRRTESSYATFFCDEFVSLAERLDTPEFEDVISSIVRSIQRIAESTLQVDNVDAFEQCVLDIAQIAEMAGQRYRPEIGVHILERNLSAYRTEHLADVLSNSMYRLVELFTDHGKQLKRDVVVLLCDALYVCVKSYLRSPNVDERAVETARAFWGELCGIGLTAVRTQQGDALWTTVFNMRNLADEDFLRHEMMSDSLAWHALDLGMRTESQIDNLKLDRLAGQENDLIPWLVELCRRCAPSSLDRARFGLYGRGVSGDIPIQAQKAFLERVDGPGKPEASTTMIRARQEASPRRGRLRRLLEFAYEVFYKNQDR